MALYSVNRELGPAPTDARASLLRPPVSVYGPEDVFYSPTALGYMLRIIEQNRVLSLPIRKVGTVYLCWLNVKENRQLADVGANIIAAQLRWVHTNLHEVQSVGTPTSSKSTACMEEGVRRFSKMVGKNVAFFVYPSGYDRETVAQVSAIEPIEYTPVTAKPGQPKFAGVTAEQARIVRLGGHVLADDVVSLGRTIEAHGLVAMQAGGLELPPAVVAIAQERLYGPGYPGEPTPFVLPRFMIPVFAGGLSGQS